MPAKRELSMRQLRHLLRLHHDGVSAREIGRRMGVTRQCVHATLHRAFRVRCRRCGRDVAPGVAANRRDDRRAYCLT